MKLVEMLERLKVRMDAHLREARKLTEALLELRLVALESIVESGDEGDVENRFCSSCGDSIPVIPKILMQTGSGSWFCKCGGSEIRWVCVPYEVD